jgi:hypothetical protein
MLFEIATGSGQSVSVDVRRWFIDIALSPFRVAFTTPEGRELLGALAHCEDPMPSIVCQSFEFSSGTTFGEAARLLLASLDGATTFWRPDGDWWLYRLRWAPMRGPREFVEDWWGGKEEDTISSMLPGSMAEQVTEGVIRGQGELAVSAEMVSAALDWARKVVLQGILLRETMDGTLDIGWINSEKQPVFRLSQESLRLLAGEEAEGA